MSDYLTNMLNQQRKWQYSLGYEFHKMSVQDRVAYAKEMSIHIGQELNESLYELPFFKPWKDYSKMSEEAQLNAIGKAQGEVVDLWHFFMNYMLALDMDAESLYQGYLDKNKENYARQEEGYTHDKSYRG